MNQTPTQKDQPSETAGDGTAARLAGVLVDACLARSPFALVPAQQLAPLVRELLLAALRSPEADAMTAALLRSALDALRPRARLRDGLPPELLLLVRELVARPYTLNRELLVGALSLRPCQRLTRELMVGTLLDFSRRVRTAMTTGGSDGGKARGGVLGRLATEAVRKSTSVMGTLAPNVTSAVTDEFERQLQRRAAEFAESEAAEMVQRLATVLADPTRAAEHKELKLALLEFVLDRPGSQLVAEIERAQPVELAALLRAAVLAWLEREGATAELTAALKWIEARLDGQTLAALLQATGALPALRAVLAAYFTPTLQPLIQSGELLRLLTPRPT
jgi:hypothetical protein